MKQKYQSTRSAYQSASKKGKPEALRLDAVAEETMVQYKELRCSHNVRLVCAVWAYLESHCHRCLTLRRGSRSKQPRPC